MTNYLFDEGVKERLPIGKIICLARNYKKHAAEMNVETTIDPVIFLKPSSSVIFTGDTIIIPKRSKKIHHEVELGIVISKKCKNVDKEFALDYVFGYLIGIDITARDIQLEFKKRGLPWTISKGFDTFTPIGSIVSKENIPNPDDVYIELRVNQEIRQKSNTKNMVFNIEQIIEFSSEIMTLERGDLILTGTPEGVGEIFEGDILEARLDNKKYLQVDVKKEQFANQIKNNEK
jgi:2-keto-4-pentenoate hydratase/2-oxohepta-3-ene-1,7-dioic acid hydratase in catechol pathway